jgi:hypothetical protein
MIINMKKILLFCFLIKILTINSSNINLNRVDTICFMNIANNKISVGEFLYAYTIDEKNTKSKDTLKINEYLNKFIDYKLYVIEAQSFGIDTTNIFKKELAGYTKGFENDLKKVKLFSDGLLLFEILNNNVWEKAKDEEELKKFYIKNRKKFSYSTFNDVKNQVVADYQEYLKEEFQKTLRTKYPVLIDKEKLYSEVNIFLNLSASIQEKWMYPKQSTDLGNDTNKSLISGIVALSEDEVLKLKNKLQELAIPLTLNEILEYKKQSNGKNAYRSMLRPDRTLFVYLLASGNKVDILTTSEQGNFLTASKIMNDGKIPTELNPQLLFSLFNPINDNQNIICFSEIMIYKTNNYVEEHYIYEDSKWYKTK